MPGVRIARDIEYIHRMRVASRRARSALQLFGECFPAKLHRRWQKGVRAVTRSLGLARDLDVQIDVLKNFRKEHDTPEYKVGVNHVLYHIRQKRRDVQSDVLKNLDNIERRGTLHEISLYLQESLRQYSINIQERSSPFILHRARSYIVEQLEAVLEYEPYVDQEDADDELHQMRIAAKRLRYTMEIFADLYGDGLNVYIKAVKKIQKYLGEMHDCVVWLSYLPKFIKVEKKHIVRYKDAEQRLKSIIQGVHLFEVDRKQTRLTRYRNFYEHWQRIKADGLFTTLRAYLTDKTVGTKN